MDLINTNPQQPPPAAHTHRGHIHLHSGHHGEDCWRATHTHTHTSSRRIFFFSRLSRLCWRLGKTPSLCCLRVDQISLIQFWHDEAVSWWAQALAGREHSLRKVGRISSSALFSDCSRGYEPPGFHNCGRAFLFFKHVFIFNPLLFQVTIEPKHSTICEYKPVKASTDWEKHFKDAKRAMNMINRNGTCMWSGDGWRYTPENT